MEVLGTGGRVKIAPNGDGTFRVELHSGFGGMAACDFTWDGLTALSSLALLRRDQLQPPPGDPGCTCGFVGLRHTPSCATYHLTAEGGFAGAYPPGGGDDDGDIW